MQNKDHWYDGLFYDRIIAPNQDRAYRIVKSIVTENSTLLDVGCGTGRLAFQLEDMFSRYDGIDLSKRNIDSANKNRSSKFSNKIFFHHYDVLGFLKLKNRHYDFAVISYVIHEIDKDERENILLEISKSVNKIIIIDYLYPRPNSFWNFLNEVVEFVAGRNHYKNFKSYIKSGGIVGLAERTGLRIVKEIKNTPSTTHIVVLDK